MYDFSGKIAVVTGAAQGLGEAIAKRFLNDGIPGVALLDLNEEVLAATAARLDPEGNRVMPVACDVSDPDSVAQAFQAVERPVWNRSISWSTTPALPGTPCLTR